MSVDLLAGLIWDELHAKGSSLPVGQLVSEAKRRGLLRPHTDQKKPGYNLNPMWAARRRVAELHPGWHVSRTEANHGEVTRKFWSLAAGPDPQSIDWMAALALVDLEKLARAATDRHRSGRYGCPFHVSDSGASTTLALTKDRKHWKCFRCGAAGDGIDWLVRSGQGPDRRAVARQILGLDVLVPSTPAHRPRPEPAAPPAIVSAAPSRRPVGAAWEDPEWQAAVDTIVAEAAEVLWSKAGRPALDWLRRRGLDDSTISRFRLGFVPAARASEPLEVLGVDDRGRPRHLWAPRGIVVPWIRPGGWYDPDEPCPDRWVGCNVRQLCERVDEPWIARNKYIALAGSERGHGYPFGECSAVGEPALICEGEFDALIAWQEAGWVANAVTFGGAGQASFRPDAKRFLICCPDWALLFDSDEAGNAAARRFESRAGHRCRRLRLPEGFNDLTDLHRDRGDVLAWLRDEWSRLGWDWPHSRGITTPGGSLVVTMGS